jgi:hypothetical protein
VYAIAPPMSSTVGLAEQLLDDVDLVGNFRAAEDRDERPLRRVTAVAEELQLFLDEEADDARLALHGLRDAERAGVLAVGGANASLTYTSPSFASWRANFGSFFSSSL